MNNVRSKTRTAGVSGLALSFVLPHETKPLRLPVVPATLTATLAGMSDMTKPVPDGAVRRAFLCRDAAYPLWMEQTISAPAFWAVRDVSTGGWTIPPTTNTVLPVPDFDNVQSYAIGGCLLDGATLNAGGMADLGVIGVGGDHYYIPPGSCFAIEVFTGAAGGAAGSGLIVDLEFFNGGETQVSTVQTTPIATGFQFAGTAGTLTTTSGALVNGVVPAGFVRLMSWRTASVTPTAAAAPAVSMGWSTGTGFGSVTGSGTFMLPVFMPPEFNNSTLPYGRTRLNSSAALFTNVSATLSKEGTILAARLKPAVVDPWFFTTQHINSVHPDLRYYGPLEKGLYTFTTPSGNLDNFDDHWAVFTSGSSYNPSSRPLFNFRDIGLYNAISFADLGSSATSTQLAVSCYVHLEFESTSSLFNIGVSTMTLESLHAAEVALLRFGHFHENWIHVAELMSAVKAAVAFVAPMVAPYVRQAGVSLAKKGIQYLGSKIASVERTMPQAALTAPPRPKQQPRKRPKAQPKKARAGRRRK